MHHSETISIKQKTNFAETLKYFLGRVPLGNIQSPFNFAEADDNYKNGQVFHVQSVVFTPVKEEDIQAFFEQQFGRVNIFWTARHVFNFDVQFQNKDKEAAFARHLEQNNGICMSTLRSSLVEIAGVKFLAFSDDKYADYLRGAAAFAPDQLNPTS